MKVLDSADLDFSRYADTLFEVLFAGGRLATGGNLADEQNTKDKLATNVRQGGAGRDSWFEEVLCFLCAGHAAAAGRSRGLLHARQGRQEAGVAGTGTCLCAHACTGASQTSRLLAVLAAGHKAQHAAQQRMHTHARAVSSPLLPGACHARQTPAQRHPAAAQLSSPAAVSCPSACLSVPLHMAICLSAPPPAQVLNTEATTEALLPYIKVFQSLIRWARGRAPSVRCGSVQV